MRIRISTMVAVCGLAALMCTPMSSACDKEKVAGSSCGSKEAKTVQVVGVGSGCCKGEHAQQAAVNVKVACNDSLPADQVMQKLLTALHDMNKCQGGCAARADVVAAVRILVESNPELATMGVRTMLASGNSCGSHEAATMAAGNTSHCGSAKAIQASSGKSSCNPAECPMTGRTVAASGKSSCNPAECPMAGKTVAASGKSTCDPGACQAQAKVVAVGGKSSCDPSACQGQAKVVAVGGKSCDPAACSAAKTVAAGKECCGSTQARYVAFGCEKTDHMARALARAYLDLMRELKAATGAKGCSAEAATQVLASVLNEMSNEQTATASAEEVDVEVAPVSLGAVGEEHHACSKTCGASRN